LALNPGTRLGPFEILSAIGAGGMGEVYRARDTTLGRQVAIKVLPEAFAQDAERLARFEREAQTLASLNYSHIAQIHGLERSSGVQALVMELVAGQDLSQRIAHGPIPLEEALPIAHQIAEALEAAHEQGIYVRPFPAVAGGRWQSPPRAAGGPSGHVTGRNCSTWRRPLVRPARSCEYRSKRGARVGAPALPSYCFRGGISPEPRAEPTMRPRRAGGF
jgi:hypothetical protein